MCVIYKNLLGKIINDVIKYLMISIAMERLFHFRSSLADANLVQTESLHVGRVFDSVEQSEAFWKMSRNETWRRSPGHNVCYLQKLF